MFGNRTLSGPRYRRLVKITVITWNTTVIDGIEYLVVDLAKFRIPLDWDPSSNMFMAIAVPDGGIGNWPALVKGEDGVTPDIDLVVDLTPLAYDDPTSAWASFSETSPAVYRLDLGLHEGAPGDTSPFALEDATDLAGSHVAGKTIIAVTDGFEYTSPKVGDSYWPATIASTPSGNAGYTLCSVSIPAQPWAWRPAVAGQCVVTGTGADVRVDLIARLDNATSGNIVGRGFGELAGVNATGRPTVLIDGPPAGSADAYNKVAANTAAVVYLRAERQTGADTFTTSATYTSFRVKVEPVP